MTSVISMITAFVTGAIGWLGQVFTFVTAEGHELALVALVAGFAGLGIHWFRMLVHN